MIISVMFEFLEYSLEHQLPNFSECWWDHVRTNITGLLLHIAENQVKIIFLSTAKEGNVQSVIVVDHCGKRYI